MYKPNYHISDHVLNTIAKIEAVRSRIDSSYILPEREVEMRYRATVEATHSSTSIEGNPLNMKQVEQVLSKKTPSLEKAPQLTRHQYAEIEVRNYKEALDFIKKRKRGTDKLAVSDILTLHKIIANKLILEAKKVGAWRKNPVYIIDQDDNLVYDAPEANKVQSEITELLVWINGASHNLHPVIAAAIFHFQFVCIHPFADGNGRTTRLLTMLYLGLRGYDFRDALVLDSYYSVDKKAYYEALRAAGSNYSVTKQANLNTWITYFTDGFLASANVLAAEVTLLSAAVQQLPHGTKLARDEADILSYVQQFGSITLSEAEGVLPQVSRRTVQRKLKNLVDSGYIKAAGTTSGTRYYKLDPVE